MISEPSDFPTFMSPIVLTRQDDQPSVNFLAPMRTLIEESPVLIARNIANMLQQSGAQILYTWKRL